MLRMSTTSPRQSPRIPSSLYLMLLAGLTFLGFGGVSVLRPASWAAAQDAVVPFDPTACVVPEILALRTPAAAPSTPEPTEPDLWDYTEGDPIDPVLGFKLIDYVYAFLACSNAGDAEGALSFVSADYFRRHTLPLTDSATPSQATPRPTEDTQLSFTVVDDIRAHGPDVATLFMTIQDPTYCVEDVVIAFVLRQVDSLWYIDDHAQVIDYQPLPWDPPVLRGSAEQTCVIFNIVSADTV